jgi:hypothetical protein
MDSEDLANWLMDRILDADRAATVGPLLTVVNRSEFEMTMGDGRRAKVTLELMS